MTRAAIYRFQVILGLVYIGAGAAKLAGATVMVQAFDAIGLGDGLRSVVGVLEIMGGLCLLFPPAAVYAALLLACMVVGIMGATIGHVASLGIGRAAPVVPQLAVSRAYEASLPADAPIAPLPRPQSL